MAVSIFSVAYPRLGVKITPKSFIIRGMAGPLMKVSVKVTAKSFIFTGVARRLLRVGVIKIAGMPG